MTVEKESIETAVRSVNEYLQAAIPVLGSQAGFERPWLCSTDGIDIIPPMRKVRAVSMMKILLKSVQKLTDRLKTQATQMSVIKEDGMK